MNGRKRKVQIKFYVTEEERALIEQKMKLVPTQNMTAALPFMDEDMRPFAERTLQKISPLTENEYAELAIFAADEV